MHLDGIVHVNEVSMHDAKSSQIFSGCENET